ncbi:hypothetical protein ASC90_25335 [Rhizobium sp. Root1220]|nr:hypothetical protein ASC90_25335 [Rhizobium sp. Root1220]
MLGSDTQTCCIWAERPRLRLERIRTTDLLIFSIENGLVVHDAISRHITTTSGITELPDSFPRLMRSVSRRNFRFVILVQDGGHVILGGLT